MRIGVHKLLMSSPNERSGLERVIDAGTIDPREIVALIGKPELARAPCASSSSRSSARRRQLGRIRRQACRVRVARQASPHATGFTRSAAQPSGVGGKRLALVTRDFAPEEVGTVRRSARRPRRRKGAGRSWHRQRQGRGLRGAVDAGLADADSAKLVTRDPNGSNTARGATALGVALALGEVAEASLGDAAIAQRLDLFDRGQHFGGRRSCATARFCSSATPRRQAATCASGTPYFVTLTGVRAAIADAKGDPSVRRPRPNPRHLRQGEAPPNGVLRGRARLTLFGCRHQLWSRAVIASVTGDAAIFVSGGTEHQCKPGEAPIAAIVRELSAAARWHRIC